MEELIQKLESGKFYKDILTDALELYNTFNFRDFSRFSNYMLCLILIEAGRRSDIFDFVKLVIDSRDTNCDKSAYEELEIPLAQNCCFGNMEVVKYLVEKAGSNIRANEDYALVTSCGSGNIEIFNYLLSRGIDLNTTDRVRLLRVAAQWGQLEMFKYLITLGLELPEDIELLKEDGFFNYPEVEQFIHEELICNAKTIN